MSKIQFIISGVQRRKFSGGLLCIFEYANHLTRLGHEVTTIPLEPSEAPQWFTPEFRLSLPKKPSFLSGTTKLLSDAIRYFQNRSSERKASLREAAADLLVALSRFGTYPFRRASHLEIAPRILETADVTIATSFETALIVHLYGSGEKFHFMQHYEPLFAMDSGRPELARIDGELAAMLPLKRIANSSWLAKEVKKRHRFSGPIPVCNNAIDHGTFFPEPQTPASLKSFVVLSYGGRNATWKGFADAAAAVRKARETLPDLVWNVFGDALLPPDNPVAPYNHLGFLAGPDLRRAYCQADVLLNPSWYESFPLFPLEAMACGTAVITTPYGTEDFAVHRRNALVVEPRDTRGMARAIIDLYQRADLKNQLVQEGLLTAKSFTWYSATKRLVTLLAPASQHHSGSPG